MKTTGDPSRIAADVRSMIRSFDSNISVPCVQPLTTWVSDAVAQPRFRTILVSSIAVITLVLAMVGLYGVIAVTAQRTSEIGVRIAIGARRTDVIRMVLIEGARLAIDRRIAPRPRRIVLGVPAAVGPSSMTWRRPGRRFARRGGGVIRRCAGSDLPAGTKSITHRSNVRATS